MLEWYLFHFFIILSVFIPYLLTLKKFPYIEVLGGLGVFITSQIKLWPHVIILDECHPVTFIGTFIGFVGFLKFVLDRIYRKIWKPYFILYLIYNSSLGILFIHAWVK